MQRERQSNEDKEGLCPTSEELTFTTVMAYTVTTNDKGGRNMSETEFQRLAAQLSEMQSDISVIKERISSYPELKRGYDDNHLAIKLLQQTQANMQSRCDSVQASKKEKVAPWITIRNTVIAGSIMLVIGTLFGFFLTLLAK